MSRARLLIDPDAWRRDDGDVPGWVLITVMTAGLVVVIWTLAGPALGQILQDALARVAGF